MRAVIRGSDGALWTRSWNGSSWTGWTSLGGALTSGPVDQRPPRRDLRRRGPRHRRRRPPQGLHPGRRLDGLGLAGRRLPVRAGRELPPGHRPDRRRRRRHRPPALLQVLGAGQRLVRLGRRSAAARRGRPSIISPGSQHLEIYARGTDGQLYEKYWMPSTSWSEYLPLGGGLSSGVAATTWDANRRDIFARGSDGALWIRSWTNTGGWSPWARLGGLPGSGPGRHGDRPEPPPRLRPRPPARDLSTASRAPGRATRASATRRPSAHRPRRAVVPGPTPGSSLRLNAGFGCIPVGGRVPVRVRIKARSNRLKPRVIKVVFFVDRGKRKRTDRQQALQDAHPGLVQARLQAPRPRAHLLPPQGPGARAAQDGVQALHDVPVAAR